MKFVGQSLLIILAFVFVFVWQQGPFSDFTIPILGFLVFVYVLTTLSKKGKSPTSIAGGSFDIPILITIILLLIFSTGGLTSSLFFLLYFLGFGIAFIFEPATVFVFVIAAFLIFLPDALKADYTQSFIRTISLIFISPLAFFFGKQYREKNDEDIAMEGMQQDSQDAANKIAKKVEDVLQAEKQTLKEQDVEKLDEILEETEKLRKS